MRRAAAVDANQAAIVAALRAAGCSVQSLASLGGGLSALAGFYMSYAYDLPLGPVAVSAACVLLGLSWLAKAAAGLRAGPREIARLGA